MSTRNLLEVLIEKKYLTSDQERNLRSKLGSSRQFLEDLILVYEQKTRKYIDICLNPVKRKLPPDEANNEIAIQKIMDVVFAALLNVNPIFIVTGLKTALKDESDLLASLGLCTQPSKAVSLLDESTALFVNIIARYRLFHLLPREELRSLCIAAESNEFPLYLYNSFWFEEDFARGIKTELNALSVDVRNSEKEQRLANNISRNIPTFGEAIRSLCLYIGRTLNELGPNLKYRSEYYVHLNSHETQVEFVNAITSGYLQKMISREGQHALSIENTRLLSSNISKVCLPALSIMDFDITIDTSVFQAGLRDAENKLILLRKLGGEIDKNAELTRKQAHQEIDKWRANIPKRDITLGIQIGMPQNRYGNHPAYGIKF